MLADKLYDAVNANGHVCVGLDTEITYLPENYLKSFESEGEAIISFNKAIIDQTYDLAACYKVQIAYYEAMGLAGMRAYVETLRYLREKGCMIIGDIKRGDIQKTAGMYAKGHFQGDFEVDWVTLNAYMGVNDSLEPYLEYVDHHDKGIFVLIRTSNNGARDFQYMQDDTGKTLYTNVGEKLQALAEKHLAKCGFSGIGGVVGCTNNESGVALRNTVKNMFLLIPGYGAQGGGAKDVAPYLIHGNGGVVNASRGIITAYRKMGGNPLDFHHAARQATIQMRDEIWREIK